MCNTYIDTVKSAEQIDQYVLAWRNLHCNSCLRFTAILSPASKAKKTHCVPHKSVARSLDSTPSFLGPPNFNRQCSTCTADWKCSVHKTSTTRISKCAASRAMHTKRHSNSTLHHIWSTSKQARVNTHCKWSVKVCARLEGICAMQAYIQPEPSTCRQ